MGKSVKVEKEVFDAILGKLIRAPAVPLSKIATTKKKSATVIPAKPAR